MNPAIVNKVLGLVEFCALFGHPVACVCLAPDGELTVFGAESALDWARRRGLNLAIRLDPTKETMTIDVAPAAIPPAALFVDVPLEPEADAPIIRTREQA